MKLVLESDLKIKQLTIIFEDDNKEEVKITSEITPSYKDGILSQIKKSEPVKKDLEVLNPCLEIPQPSVESNIDPEFASSQF